MLINSSCLLCGTTDELAPDQICPDCFADLPSHPPGICPGCGAPACATTPCRRCFVQLPAFDCCIAGCLYLYPVNQMVKKLKYRMRLDLVRCLTQPLVERIRREGVELPDCLVPMPLHSARQRRRGFNQAREIARTLAQNLCLPVNAHLVRRHKDTAQQYRLRPEQRKKNVMGAFSTAKPISYTRLAIVDDVLTSGATANELARLLKGHGVEHVQVWCVARAPAAGP